MNEDLAQLKALVSVLTYEGDDLAFDKALSEIDLVIFRMRQGCFKRPLVEAASKMLAQDNPYNPFNKELDQTEMMNRIVDELSKISL